jgi:hypothetical protein
MAEADGHYTGEIDFYAYAANKASAIRALALTEDYDLEQSFAYSDSITDVPLLEAVGHPYAVNPDRALRKEAAARDWPVLVFSRPVQLKQRSSALTVSSRPVLVAAAVGAAATTAGLVWYAAKRRSATA